MKKNLHCGHCGEDRTWDVYVYHVRECIFTKMLNWNQAAYEENYHRQVRATSRYKQPGDPRRRAVRTKSWGWWAVPRPDGLPIQSLLPRK